MRRRVVEAAVATVVVLATAACGQRSTNVVPPTPGAPASAARIAGIYRTVQGSTLQLRDNGDFFLLTSAGPIDGRFDVGEGSFTVRGGRCGPRPGRYTVRVTGKPEPNKAILEFTLVEDGCAERHPPLIDQRWVYIES